MTHDCGGGPGNFENVVAYLCVLNSSPAASMPTDVASSAE